MNGEFCYTSFGLIFWLNIYYNFSALLQLYIITTVHCHVPYCTVWSLLFFFCYSDVSCLVVVISTIQCPLYFLVWTWHSSTTQRQQCHNADILRRLKSLRYTLVIPNWCWWRMQFQHHSFQTSVHLKTEVISLRKCSSKVKCKIQNTIS